MAQVVPDEPKIQQLYRGYIITPADNVDKALVSSVEYQFRFYSDDATITEWDALATANKVTAFGYLHPNLYENVYYHYRYRVNWKDTTQSDWSDFVWAGAGKAQSYVDTPPGSIDQIAGSLGTFTSGILRGLIFETSQNNPKLRIDPAGIYAISTLATPLNFDVATGSLTITGNVTGSNITGGSISGTNVTGGNITGTNVSGGIITGSRIRTNSSSAARVELDSTSLKSYDNSNNIVFEIMGAMPRPALSTGLGDAVTETFSSGASSYVWHAWSGATKSIVIPSGKSVLAFGGGAFTGTGGSGKVGPALALRVPLESRSDAIGLTTLSSATDAASLMCSLVWQNYHGGDFTANLTLDISTRYWAAGDTVVAYAFSAWILALVF